MKHEIICIYYLLLCLIIGCRKEDKNSPAKLPEAPTSLKVTQTGRTECRLEWVDNSTNEDGFRIERKIGNGVFSLLGTIGSDQTIYIDKSVVSDSSYRYRIYSFNAAGNSSVPSNEVTITIGSSNSNLSGWVQKGPFLNGTQVLMSELSGTLDKTGRIYNSQINDNTGIFKFNNVSLISNFVDLSASGYYFNEVSGAITGSTLTLFALADINNASSVNLNMMTHLEKRRVEYLFKQGKSFSEAKKTAQSELLNFFGFPSSSSKESEKLDISKSGEDNAVLLAVSLLLQGNQSIGSVTELLAKISSDLETDGIIDTSLYFNILRVNSLAFNSDLVRQRLVSRYQSLGVPSEIPDFEKYIEQFRKRTSQKPVVSIGNATSVTSTTAVLNGQINPNSDFTNVFFDYGPTTNLGNKVPSRSSPLFGHQPTADSAILTNLTPSTTYYYRIIAENRKGDTITAVRTFKTLSVNVQLTTTSITDITFDAAKSGGNITSDGGFPVTDRGVVWSTSQNPTILLTSKTSSGSGIGTFSSNLTGLILNTPYYVRAYATNSAGTFYGNQLSFKTSDTLVCHVDDFNPSITYGSMTDQEGNVYKTVSMGTQVWMAENLRSRRFQNGDLISQAASVWYDNDSARNYCYGRLYSWYTVVDTRKLCPSGWHVPTSNEWYILANFLGGQSGAGTKMKSAKGWRVVGNSIGTNSSGFTARPGGYFQNGVFTNRGNNAQFWTTTAIVSDAAGYVDLYEGSDYLHIGNINVNNLNSVRCVKD